MSTKNCNKNSTCGVALVKSLIQEIPSNSGIYKMLDSDGKILYIGKAKNLKKRVTSYTLNNNSPRIAFMVSQIYNVEYSVTYSETEALLLEANLIKKYHPKYNILLKDDKTFPFLQITSHPYPRLTKFRSKKATLKTGLFGPFASANAVTENIKIFQTYFQIRTCSDSYFNNRTKPCILYQIKRCSAPCVNKISQENYKNGINALISFLNGKSNTIKEDLTTKMLDESNKGNYEQAIIFRDRITALNSLTTKQNIILNDNINKDYIVVSQLNNSIYFTVMIVRNGKNYGTANYHMKLELEEQQTSLVKTVIMQFYTNRNIPKQVILNIDINDESLDSALSQLNNNVKTKVTKAKSRQDIELINLVDNNHNLYIDNTVKESNKWEGNFQDLQKLFNTEEINRIEVYDNSHFYGTFSLGVMICANKSGFNSKEYRVFNLKSETVKKQDDYAIMHEVLYRRFSKLTNQNKPELILIDGGKGQLNIAIKVLTSLAITNITAVGVSKGPNRNANEETLHLTDGSNINLEKTSPILHFIQKLRNEAHRFAITKVRNKKLKSFTKSNIDNISGIDPNHKK